MTPEQIAQMDPESRKQMQAIQARETDKQMAELLANQVKLTASVLSKVNELTEKVESLRVRIKDLEEQMGQTLIDIDKLETTGDKKPKWKFW